MSNIGIPGMVLLISGSGGGDPLAAAALYLFGGFNFSIMAVMGGIF